MNIRKHLHKQASKPISERVSIDSLKKFNRVSGPIYALMRSINAEVRPTIERIRQAEDSLCSSLRGQSPKGYACKPCFVVKKRDGNGRVISRKAFPSFGLTEHSTGTIEPDLASSNDVGFALVTVQPVATANPQDMPEV